VTFTVKSVLHGVASADELEIISWPFAISAFVAKIVFITIHLLLAIFLYWSAKQRDDARLRIWFYMRLILGIFVVLFLIADIFHLLSAYGFDLYTVFLLSLYISWACFIVYSLLIVHCLIQEINEDYVMAKSMYRLYSGRNP